MDSEWANRLCSWAKMQCIIEAEPICRPWWLRIFPDPQDCRAKKHSPPSSMQAAKIIIHPAGGKCRAAFCGCNWTARQCIYILDRAAMYIYIGLRGNVYIFLADFLFSSRPNLQINWSYITYMNRPRQTERWWWWWWPITN